MGRETSHEDAVGAYYDRRVASEWQRLDGNWLEYAVTRHFIDRFVPTGSDILDIGGGPGRYALDLTASGHRVALADLSAANVAFAEKQAKAAGLELPAAVKADARDLSGFADATFDAVLNLGPLYHLLDEGDRVGAIKESLRVLKPGGSAFFAFISRYAPLHFLLKSAPGEIADKADATRRILESGFYEPRAGEDFFVDAHFADPAEIEPFMRRFALDKLAFFGAESVMAQSEAALQSLPSAARECWLALALQVAATPAAHYASEHLVFVGRKPG